MLSGFLCIILLIWGLKNISSKFQAVVSNTNFHWFLQVSGAVQKHTWVPMEELSPCVCVFTLKSFRLRVRTPQSQWWAWPYLGQGSILQEGGIMVNQCLPSFIVLRTEKIPTASIPLPHSTLCVRNEFSGCVLGWWSMCLFCLWPWFLLRFP